MNERPRRDGLLLRLAKSFARALIPDSLWAVIHDELQDELSGRNWARWRRELWGAWQYLAVGARVGFETLRAGRGTLSGGWGVDLRQASRSGVNWALAGKELSSRWDGLPW